MLSSRSLCCSERSGFADGETTERDPNPPRRVERPGRLRREGAVPGWLTTAPTENELAERIGVAVDGFADTVAAGMPCARTATDVEDVNVDGRPQPMRRGPLHRLAEARSPIRRDDSIQAHIDEMGSAQIRSASTNGR